MLLSLVIGFGKIELFLKEERNSLLFIALVVTVSNLNKSVVLLRTGKKMEFTIVHLKYVV